MLRTMLTPGHRRRLGALAAVLGVSLFAVAYLYSQYGHTAVLALYDGEVPFFWLTYAIKRQAEHPVSYYFDAADRALGGSFGWCLSVFALYALRAELVFRRPAGLLANKVWSLSLGITASIWLLYVFGVPLFQLLPFWFWSLDAKPLPYAWFLLPLAAMAVVVTRRVLRHPRRPVLNLTLMMATCYVLQLGLAFAEGRGVASLAERLLGTGGHARLAARATEVSPWSVASAYAQLIDSGQLEHFPHATRPPGALLFFSLVSGVASHLSVDGDEAEALARVASFLFPFLAALALVPLYSLCRLFHVNEREAWVPPLLYLCIPSVLLIVLHLDQCLFPLIAWTSIACFAHALLTGRSLAAWAAGICLYLGLYLSFGLALVLPVLAALAVLLVRSGHSRWPLALRAGLGSLAAAGALHAAAWVWLDYDAITRFFVGTAAHRAFKFPSWGLGHTVYFGLLNTLEFALWSGPAVTVLAGAWLWRLARVRSSAAVDQLLLALSAGIGLLLVFGTTAGETARLWIFLVPMLTLAASRFIASGAIGGSIWGSSSGSIWGRADDEASAVYLVSWAVAVQLVTTVILKRYQDLF